MEKTQLFNVKNRSSSMVVYKIPEAGIRREFAVGETKTLPYDELLKLSYQPGGLALMKNFLQIKSAELLEDLGIQTEIEYNLDENGVIDLIKNGSLDQFLDCLDFAPIGVIDLVKKYALELPMTDSRKRDALKEKIGFDVATALENMKDDADVEPAAPQGRRVQPPVAQEGGRRTVPEYKIVASEENK